MAQPTPGDHDAVHPDIPDIPQTHDVDASPQGDRLVDGDTDGAGEHAPVEPDWDQLAADDPRSKTELLAELSEAESGRDEYLDDVRRARADYENLRKRMMREGTSQRDLGKVELAGALLEVLDDFDRTLEAASTSHDEGLAKGVELVYGKLAQGLQAQGLARIEDAGGVFDPNRHEAVQQIEAATKREQPVVAEVLRPGYELSGRVIRAAMVVVEQ